MSRQDRVEKAIQKEVSSIIHDELKDPRLGFVTIIGAEITKDLRDAKIFYSVLGQEKEYKDTRDALESASGFIRKLIGERINLRFVPTIIFKEDRSSEYSVRIQKVLDEINEKDNIKKSSRKPKKK